MAFFSLVVLYLELSCGLSLISPREPTPRCQLPRLPWNTQVCLGENGQRCSIVGWSQGSPSSDGHTGEPVSMGTRKLAQGRSFLLAPGHGHERASPSRGPSYCSGRQDWHVGREGAIAASPFLAFNHGMLLLWQSEFPPQVFPVIDFLTPVHFLRLSPCSQ